MTEISELKYEKGVLDDSQIQELADHFWQELLNDPNAQSELGIALSSANQASPFEITSDRQGIGVGEFVLAVAIHVTGRVTYEILTKVWRKYIVPKIKARGRNNIGEEKKQ